MDNRMLKRIIAEEIRSHYREPTEEDRTQFLGHLQSALSKLDQAVQIIEADKGIEELIKADEKEFGKSPRSKSLLDYAVAARDALAGYTKFVENKGV